MQASRRITTGRTLAGSVQPTEAATLCLFCEGRHQLEACRKLESKTPEEKSKFVKEKGLCFACLQHGHRSRFCKDRKTCKKCSGRHPTMLHEDRTVTPTATTGHLAPSKTGGAKLQILKVRVGLGSKKVTTNAFLDSGSTHSFITGHLLDKIKMMPQKKMPLNVSTIRGEEAMDSRLVPGLLIESLDGDNNMELPPLYVLDYIPVKAEDVPSQEDMKTWSHLQDAGVYLETLKDDEEIGLLIGGNAAGVMEPVDVCPSQDGGLYAVRTRFGWVLGGAKKSNRSVSVNRISVLEDRFENRADNQRGLSVEDARWCAQMETGCRKMGDKYEVKLPFREKTPNLEENRQVAQKRLELLKRTFQRDPKYATEYKTVMANLLAKGSTEEVPDERKGAGKWYLPHFGVRNPQKEKVRVVFDCASKYHGKSLNDTLLQGPDLTNPLFDVLVRFREQPCAFTGDREADEILLHLDTADQSSRVDPPRDAEAARQGSRICHIDSSRAQRPGSREGREVHRTAQARTALRTGDAGPAGWEGGADVKFTRPPGSCHPRRHPESTGRLKNSALNQSAKCPVILPKKGRVVIF